MLTNIKKGNRFYNYFFSWGFYFSAGFLGYKKRKLPFLMSIE